MSPVGLDVRFFNWMVLSLTMPDPNIGKMVRVPGWIVTRFAFYNGATEAATIRLADMRAQSLPPPLGEIPVAAGGCYEALPGGAYRQHIHVSGGAGGLLVVEFWYQSRTGSSIPNPSAEPSSDVPTPVITDGPFP